MRKPDESPQYGYFKLPETTLIIVEFLMNMSQITDALPHPSSTRNMYRYPGVQPFTTAQSTIFYGRKQDIADLYRLIRREAVVVLYGKSGQGKSSLLNAGIVPLCVQEGDYEPILIKFGAWTENKTETPLDIIKAYLNNAQPSSILLQKLLPDEDSIWRYAKNRQLSKGLLPLLIFDQFEELFTYPEVDIRNFQQELAELLHTELPLRYRRLLDALSLGELDEEAEEALETPLNIRIVFAIRADRMHLLHHMSEHLPNVLRNLYELRALRLHDAQIAIVEPARQIGDFHTAPFEWSPTALSTLLQYLQDPQDENRMECILLQLLCQYFEEKLVENQHITSIEASHLGDLEQIIENYYYDKLASISDTKMLASARRLIEEGLVLEGENNIRLSLHEAQIARQYNVGTELLEHLVNNRLLRAEVFLRGGYTYELTHDRLVTPVLHAKQERIAEETEAALAVARQAQEKELIEEKRKRRRVTGLAMVGFVLMLIAAVSAIWAWQQNGRLQSAKTAAQINANYAEYNEKLAKAGQKQNRDLLNQAIITAEVATSFQLMFAKNKIYELDYEEAWNALYWASQFKQKKDSIIKLVQEIAFVYLESGKKLTEVDKMIETIYKLNGEPVSKRLLQPRLEIIKRFDPINYTLLRQRYYPVMIRIVSISKDTINGGSAKKNQTLSSGPLKTYELAKTETTLWQWGLYCLAKNLNVTDYAPNEKGIIGDHPVVKVNVSDICKYANWLSIRIGFKPVYPIDPIDPIALRDTFVKKDMQVALDANTNGYRLPTEKEWLDAAKGGTKAQATIYSGDKFVDKVAWHEGNSQGKAHPVGTKLKNALGFFDMSGNVREWCWDFGDENKNEDESNEMPLRGGSYSTHKEYCKIDATNKADGYSRDDETGFRLARNYHNN